MLVGVAAEIKAEEHRIAATPELIAELRARGHGVIVEAGAGLGSSIGDDEIAAAGAEIVESGPIVFERADLILKVKEPQVEEIAMLSEGQVLFTFLHLAVYPTQAEALAQSGTTAIAYETVQLPSGELPMLTPMSEIAGRMAVQAGANYMERPRGGRGVLIGGATGVAPAAVTVIGAGNAGRHATMVAAGMGAAVTVLDINAARLREIDELRLGRVVTVQSSQSAIDRFVPESDLLVGAVLVTGARAPVIVSATRSRGCAPEASSSTSPSTRADASRRRERPRMPSRRTRSTVSRTTRWQHPRCGAAYIDLCPHQRHHAVRSGTCRGNKAGDGSISRADRRRQRRTGQDHQPGGGGLARLRVP